MSYDQKISFVFEAPASADEFDRTVYVEIKERFKQRQKKDRLKVLKLKREAERRDIETVVAENQEALEFFQRTGDNIYDGVSRLFEQVLDEPEEIHKLYYQGEWVGSYSVIEKNVLITSDHVFSGASLLECGLGDAEDNSTLCLITHDTDFHYSLYAFRATGVTVAPLRPLRAYRDGIEAIFYKKKLGAAKALTTAVSGTSYAVCDFSGTGPGWSGFPLTDGFNTYGVFNSLSGKNALFAVLPASQYQRALAMANRPADPEFRKPIGYLAPRIVRPAPTVDLKPPTMADDDDSWFSYIAEQQSQKVDALCINCYHLTDGSVTACSCNVTGEPPLVSLNMAKGKQKYGRGRLFKWYKKQHEMSSEEYEEIKQLFFDLNGRWPDEKEMDDHLRDHIENDELNYQVEGDADSDEERENNDLENAWAKYDRIQEQLNAYHYGTGEGDGSTVENLTAAEKRILGIEFGKKTKNVNVVTPSAETIDPPSIEETDHDDAGGLLADTVPLTTLVEEESESEEETEETLLARLEAIRLRKAAAASTTAKDDIAKKYAEMKKDLAQQAYEAECNALQDRIKDFQARGVVLNRTVVLNELEKRKFPPNQHMKQTLLKTIKQLKDLEVVQKDAQEKRKRAQAIVISNQEKINQKTKEVEELRNALAAAEALIEETRSFVSKGSSNGGDAGAKSKKDF